MLRAHLLPLTNCAFNKAGDKFITGSYDRTCNVWDTVTGEELSAPDCGCSTDGALCAGPSRCDIDPAASS